MAEPLKNSFGTDVPPVIADMVGAVYPELDRELITTFKKLHGRKKPPVGDPASWKRIILDLAKSVG